jgi:hypothetical protein
MDLDQFRAELRLIRERTAAEQNRILVEGIREILKYRDEIVRLRTILGMRKSGPRSNLGADVELARAALNDTDGSVERARKLFVDRVRPVVSRKAASERFTRAYTDILKASKYSRKK